MSRLYAGHSPFAGQRQNVAVNSDDESRILADVVLEDTEIECCVLAYVRHCGNKLDESRVWTASVR